MSEDEYRNYCCLWQEYLHWSNGRQCAFIAVYSPSKMVYDRAPLVWPEIEYLFKSVQGFVLAMERFKKEHQ